MKTKIPPLESGLRYGRGLNGERVCLGAYMGRPDILPDNKAAPVKLRLVRLRWVDGDYDQGAAYWGRCFTGLHAHTHIYRAVAALPCKPEHWFGHIEMFVRARDRNHAKSEVRVQLPKAVFFR